MEKLTLKELAGYYGTNLKWMINGDDVIRTMITLFDGCVELQPKKRGYRWCSFEDAKPLIYPLSMLTQEIEHNREKIIPIVELLKLANPVYFNENKENRYSEIIFKQNETRAEACFKFQATKDIILYTLMPWNFNYWIIQQLYEWHFDIHGLIERGLAISK